MEVFMDTVDKLSLGKEFVEFMSIETYVKTKN